MTTQTAVHPNPSGMDRKSSRAARPGWLLALVCVALVPHVAAHDGIILSAEATHRYPLDTVDLEEWYVEPDDLLPLIGEGCRARGEFSLGPDGARGFRFDEGNDEEGCLEARFKVVIPPGAGNLIVEFNASRLVAHPQNFTLEVNAEQALILYNQTLGKYVIDAYVTPETRAITPAANYAIPFAVPKDTTTATLGWSFYDRGTSMTEAYGVPTFGQAFSATVTDMWITATGVSVDGHREHGRQSATHDAVLETIVEIDVDLPPAGVATATSQLAITVTNERTLLAIRGPDGQDLPLSDATITATASQQTIALPPVPNGGLGAQSYRLTFLTEGIAPTLAAAPGPTTIGWLPWVTGGFPVLALALAVPALGLRRAESFTARLAWRNMWAIVIVACLVCIGAAVVAWTTLPSKALSSVPASVAAITVHAQWLGGGLIILGVAILGSRQMRRAMAAESTRERAEREAMERINKELERFAYVASHDLQEPLRKVISITQLVQQKYKGKLDQEADDFLGYAADSAERMRSLVQDLLRYSRLDNEPIVRKRIDVRSTVAAIRSDMEQTLAENKGTIDVGQIPDLAGHAGQFHQVLQNLIVNGIKYRDPDRPPAVTITGQADGRMVHIQIQDNGIGIEPRHQAKIFEIFQRLHSQHQYTGTGIGLSLVRKIVDRHGGRVWVESTPGEGSTFHVLWPGWGQP